MSRKNRVQPSIMKRFLASFYFKSIETQIKKLFSRYKIVNLNKGDLNVVNLAEFTTEKDIDIGLFEKTVRRVVLQNPNLRYKEVH